MKTGNESKADRPATNDEVRASRLARRAWWSVIFGVASFAPLVLFVLYFYDAIEWASFQGFGALGDYLPIPIRLGPALVLAFPAIALVLSLSYLAIRGGVTAASRDNTRNRPLALVGLILGGLTLDGLVSCYLALMDFWRDLINYGEDQVPFVLIAGMLIWATVVIDTRAGWIRRLRENPQERFHDEVLEHRLLRRALWSVLLGIPAMMMASSPFALKFLEDNAAFDIWRFVDPFRDEFILGVTLGSIGLGFLAAILGSTACQRRGMSGNSLAWTGIIFGIVAIGISLCVARAAYW